MASEVSICNSALAKVGQPRIASLDDGSETAAACRDQYETQRDYLLRMHPWNFATARARLGRLAEAPAYRYAHAYQMPSDWIRTVGVWDNPQEAGALDYRIEGRKVLTDSPAVFIKYVARVADPNLMPEDFREALATLMASQLCASLVQNGSLASELMDRFLRINLPRAQSADCMEDRADVIPDPSFITSRDL